MKKITTYLFLSFITLQGSLVFAQEQLCKDGVCPLILSSDIQKEKESTPLTKAITELTAENFEQFVKNSKKPIIIDFYATWCAPCKAIKPIFEELAQEEKEWVFATVDIDKNPSIMGQCGVKAVPTFVIFKNGIQWGALQGGLPKEQLQAKFKEIISKDKPEVQPQADRIMELIMAISQRDINAIKKAIASGADVNGAFETPMAKISVLSIAITSGTQEIIDLLINAGAIINKDIQEAITQQINNNEKMTAQIQTNLEYAKNKITALPTPIKQTIKIDGPELAQQFMVAFSNPAELKKLIDQGANVNAVFTLGNNQTTPLCLAMIINNKEAIDMLINAGANLTVEVINDKGQKQTLEEGIKDDLETYKQGNIKSRERLAYALGKIKS